LPDGKSRASSAATTPENLQQRSLSFEVGGKTGSTQQQQQKQNRTSTTKAHTTTADEHERDGSVRRDTSIEIPQFEGTSFEIPFPGVKLIWDLKFFLIIAILCEVPNSSGLIAGGLVQRMTSEHVVTKE
jgi:hypothetical protein